MFGSIDLAVSRAVDEQIDVGLGGPGMVPAVARARVWKLLGSTCVCVSCVWVRKTLVLPRLRKLTDEYQTGRRPQGCGGRFNAAASGEIRSV